MIDELKKERNHHRDERKELENELRRIHELLHDLIRQLHRYNNNNHPTVLQLKSNSEGGFTATTRWLQGGYGQLFHEFIHLSFLNNKPTQYDSDLVIYNLFPDFLVDSLKDAIEVVINSLTSRDRQVTPPQSYIE